MGILPQQLDGACSSWFALFFVDQLHAQVSPPGLVRRMRWSEDNLSVDRLPRFARCVAASSTVFSDWMILGVGGSAIYSAVFFSISTMVPQESAVSHNQSL